ncbi:hypothetical protein SAMN05444410_101242 [Hydrobacter penzbergensis]|uniref:Uncharacterized protein n=1 Tax=Hydrobacter penzbergensis TaxID=1235997 RepID=A0A8X8ICJ6_9BACT|nr:hypothetical protein SAMN05444410_101242 [Hydrobacter penzbergensis]
MGFLGKKKGHHARMMPPFCLSFISKNVAVCKGGMINPAHDMQSCHAQTNQDRGLFPLQALHVISMDRAAY